MAPLLIKGSVCEKSRTLPTGRALKGDAFPPLDFPEVGGIGLMAGIWKGGLGVEPPRPLGLMAPQELADELEGLFGGLYYVE